MGRRNHLRLRSGFRRARRLRSERRGVVAVVGTLLALLVFFALFGVFITQYVPLWMEENESQLASQIQAAMSTLKSGIDDQYTLGGIPTYTVPFTLSSQSVPLLAQPTIATLAYFGGCPSNFTSSGVPNQVGSCEFERLAFTAGATSSKYPNQNYNDTVTTNYLEISVPDRYYATEAYFFEADGLTGAQSFVDQSMLVPPPLNVSRAPSGGVTVTASLLVLLGSASTFTGQGSKEVTSSLSASTSVNSTGRFLTSAGLARTFNVTLTLGVHDICAWYNFLYNSTYLALGPPPSTLGSNPGPGTWSLTGSWASGSPLVSAPTSNVCLASLTSTYDVTLKIFSVSSASAFVAQDQISFNPGVI